MATAPVTGGGVAVRSGENPASSRLGPRNHIVVMPKRIPGRPELLSDEKDPSEKVLFQIRLETSPQLISQVGAFISSYAKYRFQPRTAEPIALASNELIENAVSYGSVSGDILFSLVESKRQIEVQVVNVTSAGRLSNLRAQLEKICVDPERVYQEEMGRSVAGTGGRAALGLARICFEGQMGLMFDVDGYNVTMCAWCPR